MIKVGIYRIQFLGPWLDPGVPPRVAYFHTHWVAVRGPWVLDTVVDPSSWIRLTEWIVRIHAYSNEAPSTGWKWTHFYELPQPGLKEAYLK